jgi:VCBS repeat-containing protein
MPRHVTREFQSDGVGDTLTVQSFDTSGTIGLVTCNGDGTFIYDPDNQFGYLAEEQQAFDTFTYTVTDIRGLTDTATITIMINGLDPVLTFDYSVYLPIMITGE